MSLIEKKMLSTEYRGLATREVLEMRKKSGFNALPTGKTKSALARVWGIVSEPMMLLLLATSIIYFFVGDRVQAAVIFASIIPITIIEFLQEKRTDNAVATLNALQSEECQVYRDGAPIKLSSHELVPGDLVYVTAGDKVAADCLVVFTPGVLVDESILTGESIPVEKFETTEETDDKKFILYQGTMILQGEARGVVASIGAGTEYGKLGKLLDMIEIKTTPLQARIEHLVGKLAIFAISAAVFIGVVLALRYGIIHGLLSALTVAIAIIPEEFPIVFSVFLIMGVMRMTKRKAVARQMALVETLGSATVICTDKTGTLTEGSLRIASMYTAGKEFSIAGDSDLVACQPLIFDALLAVEQVATDPIEIEVQRLARATGNAPEKIFSTYILRHDSSFDAKTKLVQHAWEGPDGTVVQYAAGAPEAIIERSHFTPDEKKNVVAAYEQFARRGYRVIGIAKKVLAHDESKPHDGALENDNLEFSGLLAMIDPPRAGVSAAVAEAYAAGIRLIMITGDNELTAMHLAGLIGFRVGKPPVHGDTLEKMSGEALQEIVRDTTIFTRVRPEQKYLLVEALQKNGDVVAMTGDGVNDAPALKKADIGIAMGQRGTAVARAAAGMILLDDNFSTIMHAVEEGRRIYDNLRRAFVFLFSLHIPIVGMAIFPLFFGQDLFFVPMQIIFLELFGDPAAVIGFERDRLRHGAMTSPPRPVNEPLINPKLWGVVALYGLSIFAVTLGTHLYIGYIIGSFATARTVAFAVLIFSQITLILFSRDWQLVKSNPVLLVIAGLTLGFLTLVEFVHPLTHLFSFVPITPLHFAEAAGLATVCMFVVSRIGRRIAKI